MPTQEKQVQSLEKIPLRRKWQPTPVFLPWNSHEQRSLVSYSPWGHKESDMTEWLSTHAYILGFPGGSVVKNPPANAGRCRKLRFDIWVGKILLNHNPFRSVFLPGESHGQRSLAGYSPWGCKEPDTTAQLSIRVCIYIYIFNFSIIYYYEILNSLCYTVSPCLLTILYIVVYVC